MYKWELDNEKQNESHVPEKPENYGTKLKFAVPGVTPEEEQPEVDYEDQPLNFNPNPVGDDPK